MKDIIFSNDLLFRTYVHTRDYHTDMRAGAAMHFFAYMEQGQCRLVSGQDTVEVSAGEVFYIPKGLPYHSYWHCRGEVRFRSFGFHHFPESSTRQYPLQKIPCGENVKALLRALPTDREADSRLLGSFYSMVAELLPYMRCEEQTTGAAVIEKARQYISRNRTCSVPDIARHCLISEAALYDIFRREAGCTPNGLRQQLQCEQAVLLLTTTDRPVQDISDSLGFSSSSYFRKILHKYTGKTPRQIRRSAKNI